MTSRRQFITTVGTVLGATSLGLPTRLLALPLTDKLGKIGIQLYTLRTLMSKDMDGTLARVAEIGYKEVEFAGYFGRSPDRVRALLSAHGLTSPSTHIGFPRDDDAWKKTLDDARQVGHEWATIAWIDAAMRKTPDDWNRIAERFNKLGEMAKSAGMKFAYHNHSFELVRLGDTTGLDMLLSGTDRKLVDFEMDIFWVVKGGGDPATLITRYPHRFPLMHAKDATPAPELAMTDVGAGAIDFRALFSRRSSSGMQHVFVEHDEPKDPLASATASYKALSTMSF